MPEVVDQVALARLYGEPLFALPTDLYIPPDALEVFLEAFEGPLDLLLYLIRKQNFNILDIPMAAVTRQYLHYVEEIRTRNLELAAEYLLMAAMLIEIKSRMLLPPRKAAEGQEPEDPRAELVRRLLEYEQMKLAAARLNELPQLGRDFLRAQVYIEQSLQPRFPDVDVADLQEAWRDILKRAKLVQHHKITREELSVREHMSIVLRKLQGRRFVAVRGPVRSGPRRAGAGGHLHRDAGAGQGDADRADPGRGLRAHLRAARLPAGMNSLDFDVVIVGSGLAGLSVALHLAPTHRVAVLTKRALDDGSSGWAQGGIAARAGRRRQLRLARATTRWTPAPACRRARDALHRRAQRPRRSTGCVEQGVPFSQDERPSLHLTREGGHSARRIVHATDATGAAVQRDAARARARARPTSRLLRAPDGGRPDHRRTHRRDGAAALPRRLRAGRADRPGASTFRAPHTVLATGGAGKVYLLHHQPRHRHRRRHRDGLARRLPGRRTWSSSSSTRPACTTRRQRSFLITEAVRGEGGQLLLPDGTRFMPQHDPRAELAPRDIVARAIDFEMKKHGLDCVCLDISHQPREAFLQEHFPTIHARCLELGIDITRQPIPVVPAAHYTCGGVRHRPGRPHRPARPVRRRRDHLHRPARRQPAGQQLAARVRGVRPRRRRATSWPRRCAPVPDAAGLGREPGRRRRRAGRDLAQLGRAAPLHVGLRRHRAHQQAAGAGAAPHHAAAGARSTSTTRNFRVSRDLLELRNLVTVRRADRALGAARATRAAACTSAATTRSWRRWRGRPRWCPEPHRRRHAGVHPQHRSFGTVGRVPRSDIPARLDRLRWSRWHWRLVLALGVAGGLIPAFAGMTGPLRPRRCPAPATRPAGHSSAPR